MKAQPLVVEIEGVDLPGRRCGPNRERRWYENVHVAIARRGEPIELSPGDANAVSWRVEVTVRRLDSGQFDFGGPYVHGARGDRFLGLRWGNLDDDGTFELFRAAGLRLDAVDPALIEQALQPGSRLLGRLGLTDERGFPRCRGVRPPLVEWTVRT